MRLVWLYPLPLAPGFHIFKGHTYLRIFTGKKHPKIKTPALKKNTNMDIWVFGTSN